MAFTKTMPLLRNAELNRQTRLLTLQASPEEAALCAPGQFLNLRVLPSTSPLLRRPISICDARVDSGEIDLLVQVVGEGTAVLAERQPGAQIDVMGPLGTTFEVGRRPALMVAGGVGVAPLYYLARSLERTGQNEQVDFCYGARTKEQLVLLEEITETGATLHLATEDGSAGTQGYVTALAEGLMADHDIYVCGPVPMMQAMLDLLQRNAQEGQLSLENQMGCGVGACMGCVVEGREGLIRVCKDGPVVWSRHLDRLVSAAHG